MAVARVGSGFRRVVVVVVLAVVAGLLAGCEASPAVIEGRVTHAGNGSHPAGIVVRAYSADSEDMVAETVTDEEGRYVLRESDLDEGTYRLRFSDGVWWEGAASWAEATDLVVSHGGDATVIDVSLVPAVGTMSGTVTDAAVFDGSAPVAGATIDAISTVSDTVVASTTSTGTGTYSFVDIPTGTYRLRVAAQGLATTFHPSSATAAGAMPVTVVAGQQRGGLDVALPVPASLTGTVVSGGAPLAGISVAAVTLEPQETHALAVTGPDGRFDLAGLRPTGYLLKLIPAEGDSVVVGAQPDDPETGIVYPLAAGDTLEIGTVDFGAGGTAAPAIVTSTLPEAHVGVPVLASIEAVGGAGDYTWQATGLPAGLTLDAATGELSGVPTSTSSSSVEVTATDARGVPAAVTLPLVVREGVPGECVATDCEIVDLAPNAVELPADAVTAVTRTTDGTLTSLLLGPSAPAVTAGQILLVPPSEHTPEGVVVEATGVEDAGGGRQAVIVVAAALADAYDSMVIKSTEATVTPLSEADDAAGPADQTRGEHDATAAAAVACTGHPQLDVAPDVSFAADPDILVGKNRGWFTLPYFQFDLETELSVDLSGRIGGKVDCDLPLPGYAAAVPVGVGFVSFRLQPDLNLKATAGIAIDTTITLRCRLQYRWSGGFPASTHSCNPAATTPQASGTGADVTIGGGIALTGTYSEAVGFGGGIDTQLHAGYHPLQRPRGKIDGRVSADITGCLGCFLGLNLGSVTLWEDTLYERTFATWGHDALPTCGALANSHWEGTLDGDPAYPWRADFGPDGTLESFQTLGFSPEVRNVEVDCEKLSFVGTQELATWWANFDPTRTQLSGTYLVVIGSWGTWSGHRVW